MIEKKFLLKEDDYEDLSLLLHCNQYYSRFTAILKAIQGGDGDEFKSLLCKGVTLEFDVGDKGIKTSALHNACFYGRLEFVRMLLEEARVDPKQMHPSHPKYGPIQATIEGFYHNYNNSKKLTDVQQDYLKTFALLKKHGSPYDQNDIKIISESIKDKDFAQKILAILDLPKEQPKP